MKIFTLILFVVCFSFITTNADTIHVPSDQPTIQAGIDAAVEGDTVLVAPGTYMGDGNRDIDFSGKAIVVKDERQQCIPRALVRFGGESREIRFRDDASGEARPGNVLIDCQNEGRGFYFHSGESNFSILEGFTIINGEVSDGGGVYCYHSSPAITNCTISGNTACEEGGGIQCYQSSPVITNCTVSGNTAVEKGGGIRCFLHSSPVITNCTISENASDINGGGIYCHASSEPTITNCTIAGNTASWCGGGIYCASFSPVITNCTIAGNTAAEKGGGIYCADSELTITNCILWNDLPQEIHYQAGEEPVVTYSDIQGGWSGEGNIDADPLFVDPENDDFHLTLESPCVDTGTDAGVYIDIDGEPRPMGYGFDMGSDEEIIEGPSIWVYPDTFGIRCELWGQAEDETLTILSSGGEDLEYLVIPGNESWLILEGDLEGILLPRNSVDIILQLDSMALNIGEYEDTVTVLSNDPLRPSIMVPIVLEIFPQIEAWRTNGIHHVPDEFSTIQAAIDYAIDGDTVLVADGTYTGSGNRDIDFDGKAIIVTSANGPEVTIIDCGGFSHRGFNFHNDEDHSSILRSFTIENGATSSSDGGAIKCTESSPTVVNCIITACTASSGGAIYCDRSSPRLINCTISGNAAEYDDGGGIYCNNSSPTIKGCTISDNTAEIYGGGIFCRGSSPVISECVLTMNTASTAGGMYLAEQSDASILKCSITENTAEEKGGGIHCSFSAPTVSKCTLSGNISSTGAGVYFNDSEAVVENCIIKDNDSDSYDGGGIYCDWCSVHLTIRNCIISGNRTSCGGGILCGNYSCPTVRNCVFTGNTASTVGGGIYCVHSSSPVITNCIVWDDSPDEIFVESGNPVVSYSDIQGGWTGEGNIDLDPRFAPFPFHGFEYLLRPDSPCIDTGAPSIEDGLYDWHPKWPDWYPDGARSDMGAYGGPGNVDWLR